MGVKKRRSSRDDDYDSLMKKIRRLEDKVGKNYEILIDNPSQPEPKAVDGGKECPELKQDILNILFGDDSCVEDLFSEKLHKDVSTRGQHILLNSLSKDNRSELFKEYLPPENCPNVRAPKLNLEIKAALTEINYEKDLYPQSKQNQLVNQHRPWEKLYRSITKSKDDISQEILKYISDTSRLLCDYNYKEFQSRRYAIINTLNKQTRVTVKNTKIDEYLFGSGLPEHLKPSEAISKSGMELRSATTDNRPKLKAVTEGQASTAARRGTLNARGAPQAPAAEPRVNPAPRRNHAAPAVAPMCYWPSYSSKYLHAPSAREEELTPIPEKSSPASCKPFPGGSKIIIRQALMKRGAPTVS